MKSNVKIQLLTFFLSLGSMLNGKIEYINNINEYEALTAKNKYVFVKIAAEWCGACKMVKDNFNALSNEPEFKHVKFVHADSDQNRELAQKQSVTGLPTFLVVVDGKVVDKAVGLKGNDVSEYLRNIIRAKVPGAAAAAASLDVAGTVTTEETTVNPFTGEETTTQEVTTEQVKGDQAIVTQETTSSTQEADEATTGILGKIKGLFLWLFNTVRDIFMGIFNWIKGLFGK
jgi:thioredoxin 1